MFTFQHAMKDFGLDHAGSPEQPASKWTFPTKQDLARQEYDATATAHGRTLGEPIPLWDLMLVSAAEKVPCVKRRSRLES